MMWLALQRRLNARAIPTLVSKQGLCRCGAVQNDTDVSEWKCHPPVLARLNFCLIIDEQDGQDFNPAGGLVFAKVAP